MPVVTQQHNTKRATEYRCCCACLRAVGRIRSCGECCVELHHHPNRTALPTESGGYFVVPGPGWFGQQSVIHGRSKELLRPGAGEEWTGI